MDMDGMMRLSGQGRDEILCESFDRERPSWDERSRHGSPYADFVTEDDGDYDMDAWECANDFECGYDRMFQ